jgi:hypothetical protein
MAFAYILDYEKRSPCKASPEEPWRSKDMLVEDPHGGYDSKRVAWLSPYPDFTDATIFVILAFAVPAGLFALGAAVGWVARGFRP